MKKGTDADMAYLSNYQLKPRGAHKRKRTIQKNVLYPARQRQRRLIPHEEETNPRYVQYLRDEFVTKTRTPEELRRPRCGFCAIPRCRHKELSLEGDGNESRKCSACGLPFTTSARSKEGGQCKSPKGLIIFAANLASSKDT